MKIVEKKELETVVGGTCYHRSNSNGITATHYKMKAAAAKGYSGTITAVSGPGHPY